MPYQMIHMHISFFTNMVTLASFSLFHRWEIEKAAHQVHAVRLREGCEPRCAYKALALLLKNEVETYHVEQPGGEEREGMRK